MSDISIPGVSTGRFNTRQMVEDLMEVERIPVVRMEREVEQLEQRRSAWQSIGRTLTQLRDSARRMYGFENPFRDRVATASEAGFVNARATRQASEGSFEVQIMQVAARDRLSSRNLPRDFRVPEGSYTFSVGDERVSFRFGGGTLARFAEEANRRAGSIVRVNSVPNTGNSTILVFEAQKDGAGNHLQFLDAARSLALDTGVLRQAGSERLELIGTEAVSTAAHQTQRITPPAPRAPGAGTVLRFEARALTPEPATDTESAAADDAPPSNADADATAARSPVTLPDPGSITFGDVTVRNVGIPLDSDTPSAVGTAPVAANEPAPPARPAPPPPSTATEARLSLISRGRSIEVATIAPTDDFSLFELELGADWGPIEALEMRTAAVTLEVRNARIESVRSGDELEPANPISLARDARLLFNGIEIERSSNSIDDLVPGVTIGLVRRSETPIEITVEPNREAAKEAIIELVGHYNQVVRDLNIYTRTDEAIIDEIGYFTEEEREAARTRLGLFQGDASLNQLRTRLQTVMMDGYPTALDSELRLLAQIGISSNAGGAGAGMSNQRLRGYLEISETELDAALSGRFAAVAQLFGHDSDGDLVVDRGVAVAIERFVTPYVQTGGVIAGRSTGIDTQIQQANSRIARYNERLERTEATLRSDFTRMEGALQTLEQNSRALNNLGGATQQQR